MAWSLGVARPPRGWLHATLLLLVSALFLAAETGGKMVGVWFANLRDTDVQETHRSAKFLLSWRA